jgi:hypothetical protein
VNYLRIHECSDWRAFDWMVASRLLT